VACFSPTQGWYSQSLHCYFLVMTPWPPDGDPRIASIKPYHKQGDGSYFMRSCSGGAPTVANQDFVWMPNRPPGYGWRLSPDVLAARAVRTLALRGPVVRLSPILSVPQVVGLPTWAWTEVTAHTWGTHSATAAAGGESVTATAVSGSIYWTWGDGTSTMCSGPGTPYGGGGTGLSPSPDCGHTYQQSSHGARLPVTASTTWLVSWVGGGLASGARGALTVVAPARTSVRVAELQAINVAPRG